MPAIVWTLRRLAERPPPAATPRLKVTGMVLLVLTFVQLYLGALVAGLRAGLVYNTWPDIDGGLVPVRRTAVFRNAMVAQSVRQYADGAVRASHDRLYAVCAGHPARGRRRPLAGRRRRDPGRLWLAAAITLQATLGILTLLHHVPIDLALTHQAVAIAVLTLAVVQAERLAARQSEPQPAPLPLPVTRAG